MITHFYTAVCDPCEIDIDADQELISGEVKFFTSQEALDNFIESRTHDSGECSWLRLAFGVTHDLR